MDDVAKAIGALDRSVSDLDRSIDRLSKSIEKRDAVVEQKFDATDKKIEKFHEDFAIYIKKTDERLDNGRMRMNGLQMAISVTGAGVLGVIVFTFSSNWQATAATVGVTLIAVLGRKIFA